MTSRAVVAFFSLVLFVPSCRGQRQALAATPPMGWNSWDSYGLTITESQFAANVEVIAGKLKPFGWRYAVIDEGWYLQNPQASDQTAAKPADFHFTRNADGQFSPALNRFPSAANGIGLKSIGDSVHAKGLLFGLHIIRGIPKLTVADNLPIVQSTFHAADAADPTDLCPWNPDNYGVNDNAAGQAWYDGLIRQYASWGVDYLKVDCIASHPYKPGEIAMIHRAILKSGRPIVLSLSPGPTALENAAEVAQNAQLWRISDDVWDYWDRPAGKEFPKPLKRQFATIASWSKFAKPGTWPDADMLPLGELAPVPGYESPRSTRLTHDEQRTMITLWSISRSPLFMGGNLTHLDDFTASLLTNAEVLAVNQQGHDQRLAKQDGDLIAWISQGEGSTRYLALFNLGDAPATVKSPLTDYDLPAGYTAKDLWTKKDHGKLTNLTTELPPHGSLLLLLKP